MSEGLCDMKKLIVFVFLLNRVPFFGFGSLIECEFSFVSSLNRVRF